MIFNDFLNTTLASGNNPKAQLKIDLSTFKNVFNYANKSDDIYNNLIDNIVKLLSIKFGTYQIIYSNIEVMYNELLITLNPQIPQFMMIQKKQLIESLDTFGDLNNWGDVLKDNVSRNLQLTNQSSNTTNFVPIDGSDKDPYSINDVSKTNNSNETTDINRLATDYLNFYMRLNWNVGDIELNSIYESYIHLFKIYYEMDGTSTSSGGSVSDDVWNAINLNTRAISMVSDEVDALSVRVDENIIDTNANTSSISNLNNSLNTKANANDVYTRTQIDNEFDSVKIKRLQVYWTGGSTTIHIPPGRYVESLGDFGQLIDKWIIGLQVATSTSQYGNRAPDYPDVLVDYQFNNANGNLDLVFYNSSSGDVDWTYSYRFYIYYV